MESRRLFTYLAVALAVFLIYRAVYDRLSPPPPPPAPPVAAATQPAEPAAIEADAGITTPPATAPGEASAVSSAPAQSAPAVGFAAAETIEQLVLGGGPEDDLQLELTSRGAAVDRLKLTARKKDGMFVHRAERLTNEPYALLEPVPALDGLFPSYVTRRIQVDGTDLSLAELPWEVVERGTHHAVFATTLRSADGGEELLRVTKTFELEPSSAVLRLRLSVRNLGGASTDIVLNQNGPVGVRKENRQYDMRKLVCARRDEGEVEGESFARGKLQGETRILASSAEQFAWTALSNKYFAVFTRPLPRDAGGLGFVEKVEGTVVIPGAVEQDPGDYIARIITAKESLAPGEATEYAFEIYAGTKNEGDLEKANADYADRTKIGYVAARDADQRCCCTFPFLTSLMTGLLEAIQVVVRNYGVAIIILVVIIRTLLHPLSVFQQKSMYKMQEAQARLQPKLNAIKEKHPNDRQRQSQEQMKLYSEEGVNPMASMVGMLPMMVQMPILIALWTALNTDVHLRHAGFDPWWITDLSAPDALYEFAKPIDIPILAWLPLIGRMFQGIPAINVLPLLMGVSMWLQQKYMPKPGMQAKLEAAKKTADEPKPHKQARGMSPEEQARQQQMIMNMMSVMFPLMFYYMPAGLNLYWMATNVFGIGESLRIRGQIKRDKERREIEGVQPVKEKKPGVFSRILKHMAAQAEDLQKRADELSQEEEKKKAAKRRRGPDKP